MKKNPAKSKATSESDIVREEAEKVLKMLDISGTIDVIIEDEGANITLTTSDSGIVIGYHGETLESLQLLLSHCISKKLERFIRVSLEVGDYKKNRTDRLETLAFDAKERALSRNEEVSLSGLKAWERRVVHLLLQEDQDVMSESIGEGRDRTLVIKPR